MIQHDASPLISGIYCSGPLLDFALTCARSYGYVILRLGSLLKTPVATPLGLYKYLAKQALMGYSASQPFCFSPYGGLLTSHKAILFNCVLHLSDHNYNTRQK